MVCGHFCFDLFLEFTLRASLQPVALRQDDQNSTIFRETSLANSRQFVLAM
jgi:hypothetical protein